MERIKQLLSSMLTRKFLLAAVADQPNYPKENNALLRQILDLLKSIFKIGG